MAKSKVRASRARHEEPVEGQAGQIRCSSGNAEVEASGGAGAVEPAEWHEHYGHHGGDRLASAFGAGLPGRVVRKKLALTLHSEKSDGERVYRVIDNGAEAQAG